MKIVNNQQEEYKAFLKNIREEKEETPNIVKLVFTLIFAVLLATIVCVVFVDNVILSDSGNVSGTESGLFKFKRANRFEVPFAPKRQNILLLGVDSNGAGTDLWEGTRSDTIIVFDIKSSF